MVGKFILLIMLGLVFAFTSCSAPNVEREDTEVVDSLGCTLEQPVVQDENLDRHMTENNTECVDEEDAILWGAEKFHFHLWSRFCEYGNPSGGVITQWYDTYDTIPFNTLIFGPLGMSEQLLAFLTFENGRLIMTNNPYRWGRGDLRELTTTQWEDFGIQIFEFGGDITLISKYGILSQMPELLEDSLIHTLNTSIHPRDSGIVYETQYIQHCELPGSSLWQLLMRDAPNYDYIWVLPTFDLPEFVGLSVYDYAGNIQHRGWRWRGVAPELTGAIPHVYLDVSAHVPDGWEIYKWSIEYGIIPGPLSTASTFYYGEGVLPGNILKYITPFDADFRGVWTRTPLGPEYRVYIRPILS